MNIKKLKKKLDELGIYPNLYSLEGELLYDRTVLYNSYNDWIVFYLDERGNRNDQEVFHSEDEACQYIFRFFEEEKREFGKFITPKTPEEILELQKKVREMMRLQDKEK